MGAGVREGLSAEEMYKLRSDGKMRERVCWTS